MNYFFLNLTLSELPKPMIITISGSVIAVLLLAAFVLHMWRNQERSADIAREVRRITETINAGVVNFIWGGEGHITYASRGFYEILGISRDELQDLYNNNFFLLLEPASALKLKGLNLVTGSAISEELRIKSADGMHWILLKGNAVQRKGRILTVSGVMVDITENKKLTERVALEQERYRLATELSNDVILSYSIMDDTLNISENFKEFYGGATCVPRFSQDKIWERGFIYSEDIEKVAELVRMITIKDGGIDQQIRVRDASGAFVWCRLICMPVTGGNIGDNREYIGKLINIDLHKKQLSLLEKKAMIDPLTKAYNKEATKSLINKYISENRDNPGMLLLVDIDHFKNINDTYGHIMGDNIIIEVVRQVTRAFRSGDIIGRIGGDEFVVFVCNVRNPEDQLKQARKLHEVLRQPVTIDGVTVNKSASIGIALYPEHAGDYGALVECADQALYKVKDSGRDSFIIYSKEEEQ